MAFDNNEMFYNKRKHRYILTEECVLEEMNIDLGVVLNTSDVADVANAAENFLDRVSTLVYRYIYKVVPFRYKKERALALEDEYRAPICEAMKEQLLYILNNGDFSALSGINLESGMVIDQARLRSAEIAPLAKDILIDSGIVRAYIPKCERDITPRYEEEGY